jgi:hypothetical protein
LSLPRQEKCFGFSLDFLPNIEIKESLGFACEIVKRIKKIWANCQRLSTQIGFLNGSSLRVGLNWGRFGDP